MGNTCAAYVDVPFIVPPTDGQATAGIVILALLGFGVILTIASFATQLREPAPYGKFATDQKQLADGNAPNSPAVNVNSDDRAAPLTPRETARGQDSQSETPPPKKGCEIHQRLAHTLSDFPSGVIGITLIYALVPGHPTDARTAGSACLLCAWLLHYVHRGLIHPWVMDYSGKTTPLGICVGGMIPNWTFCTALALHLAYAGYPPGYVCDARFIAGAIIFVIGYVMNRWADLHLRSIRRASIARGGPKYVVPKAGPFRLVCNANYLGELIQWCGFAIMTSSCVAVLWVLFCLSTFLPRSVRTLAWYKKSDHFAESDLPPNWCAVIPFIL